MLHNQSETDLLLHLDATVVIPSGHEYDGVILLTRKTLFIVGAAVDAIQQTLLLHDIDLQEDDDLSCAAQKFVLTVNPMLRRILVVQFNAAKRNCAFQS